jgi:hypothetical protein
VSKRNRRPVPDIPTPPPIPTVQQEVKLEKVEQANVVSHVAPLSDRVVQDRVINAMDVAGYVHYESIPIGGNEIILRFRKK